MFDLIVISNIRAQRPFSISRDRCDSRITREARRSFRAFRKIFHEESSSFYNRDLSEELLRGNRDVRAHTSGSTISDTTVDAVSYRAGCIHCCAACIRVLFSELHRSLRKTAESWTASKLVTPQQCPDRTSH